MNKAICGLLVGAGWLAVSLLPTAILPGQEIVRRGAVHQWDDAPPEPIRVVQEIPLRTIDPPTTDPAPSPPQPRQDDAIVPIGNTRIDIRPSMAEPTDQSGQRFHPDDIQYQNGIGRPWSTSAFLWQVPDAGHRPLYFEDVNLERHGYSFGIAQPAVSAAHFFGSVIALPYLAVADHPRDLKYSLGHPRAGSHTPYYHHRSKRVGLAAAAEAGAILGIIFVFP